MTSPVALVTGAARGIGLAITQSLIAAGYRVMAADLGTDQAWNYQLGQSADIAQALQAANPSTDNAPPYAVCTVDVTNADQGVRVGDNFYAVLVCLDPVCAVTDDRIVIPLTFYYVVGAGVHGCAVAPIPRLEIDALQSVSPCARASGSTI